MLGDELLFVIKLEEFFKLRLVEDNDLAVNDSGFVALWDLDSEIGRERLKTFAVELPAKLTLESGACSEVLGDIEGLLAIFAWVSELCNNAFDALEFVFVIGKECDIFVFVLDKMN